MQYYTSAIYFVIIFTFIFTSCDDTSQDPETEVETLEFVIEPSDDLSFIVEDAPSDFTWEFYNNNIEVNLVPGSMWSGEIVLSSFQVENGEVVNRATSEPVETSASELADGLLTEELFP